jgi:hypothetical protein
MRLTHTQLAIRAPSRHRLPHLVRDETGMPGPHL